MNGPATIDKLTDKEIHLEGLTTQSPTIHPSKAGDTLRDLVNCFV